MSGGGSKRLDDEGNVQKVVLTSTLVAALHGGSNTGSRRSYTVLGVCTLSSSPLPHLQALDIILHCTLVKFIDQIWAFILVLLELSLQSIKHNTT